MRRCAVIRNKRAAWWGGGDQGGREDSDAVVVLGEKGWGLDELRDRGYNVGPQAVVAGLARGVVKEGEAVKQMTNDRKWLRVGHAVLQRYIENPYPDPVAHEYMATQVEVKTARITPTPTLPLLTSRLIRAPTPASFEAFKAAGLQPDLHAYLHHASHLPPPASTHVLRTATAKGYGISPTDERQVFIKSLHHLAFPDPVLLDKVISAASASPEAAGIEYSLIFCLLAKWGRFDKVTVLWDYLQKHTPHVLDKHCYVGIVKACAAKAGAAYDVWDRLAHYAVETASLAAQDSPVLYAHMMQVHTITKDTACAVALKESSTRNGNLSPLLLKYFKQLHPDPGASEILDHEIEILLEKL